MILKNVLLIVKDIKRSRRFYQEVLGLSVTADFGKKVMFTGGVVLEECAVWEEALKLTTAFGGNDIELYFEDTDVEGILERLEKSDFQSELFKEQGEEPMEVLRFCDPDRHMIEVRKGKY